MKLIFPNPIALMLLAIASFFLAGCAEDSPLGGTFLSDQPRTDIALNIQKDLTLKASLSPYYLEGRVVVEAGNTLTIEAGTEIRGKIGTQASLIIEQGAKIEALGTPDKPIVFTSGAPVGSRRAGDWGGLIINGSSLLNTTPGIVMGEGNTGFYGGNNPNDDSGTLQYVRIEFAGARIDADTEYNGLSLQGVGRGTTVDHVHVHQTEDDCFEFFGGTVDAKYLLCTDGHDDGFDFTEGWQGRGQFLIALMRQTGFELNRDSNGIEGTNANGATANFDASPRSNPILYNVTLVGDASSNHGVKLDRGGALQLYNSVITDFQFEGLDVESQESCASASFMGVVLEDATDITGQCTLEELNNTISFANIRPVADPFDANEPDFTSTGLAADGTITPEPPIDPFFIPTTFIGAKSTPPQVDDWQWDRGWISFPEN